MISRQPEENDGRIGYTTAHSWTGTKAALEICCCMKLIGEALETAVLRGSGFQLKAELDMETDNPQLEIMVFEFAKPKDTVGYQTEASKSQD